jgi:hypothetical protein
MALLGLVRGPLIMMNGPLWSSASATSSQPGSWPSLAEFLWELSIGVY